MNALLRILCCVALIPVAPVALVAWIAAFIAIFLATVVAGLVSLIAAVFGLMAGVLFVTAVDAPAPALNSQLSTLNSQQAMSTPLVIQHHVLREVLARSIARHHAAELRAWRRRHVRTRFDQFAALVLLGAAIFACVVLTPVLCACFEL